MPISRTHREIDFVFAKSHQAAGCLLAGAVARAFLLLGLPELSGLSGSMAKSFFLKEVRMPVYPLPSFVLLEAKWNEESSIFQISLTDSRHTCFLDCDRTALEKPFKEDPSKIIHNLVDVFRKSLEENGVL